MGHNQFSQKSRPVWEPKFKSSHNISIGIDFLKSPEPKYHKDTTSKKYITNAAALKEQIIQHNNKLDA